MIFDVLPPDDSQLKRAKALLENSAGQESVTYFYVATVFDGQRWVHLFRCEPSSGGSAYKAVVFAKAQPAPESDEVQKREKLRRV